MRGRADKHFSFTERLLLFAVFTVCLCGALLLPVTACPDEEGRLLLTDWIFRSRALPTGNEPEVIIPGWGFSYALRPYLSSLIGAAFMTAASAVFGAPSLLLPAARMCSVLSVTACCYFCLRLGRRLFERRSSALLLAAFVCFNPQVLFLGMYLNNDALSLGAVSAVLCFLTEGYDERWSLSRCVGLAISFSVALLSYYSVYGWLLMSAVFCVSAVLGDERIPRRGGFLLRRAALVGGLCLLLAGWFFLRNAWLHQGDLFGIAAEERSRAELLAQGAELYPYLRLRENGFSLLGFLRDRNWYWLMITVKSFVGMFGYMNLPLPEKYYSVYLAVFVSGFILFALFLPQRPMSRRDRLLALTLLGSSLITFALHVWHSYARDYQPQGRYVITLALAFGCMLACGADRLGRRIAERGTPAAERLADVPAAALTLFWIGLFVCSLETMAKMLSV